MLARQTLISLLGPLPQKAPPAPAVLEEVDAGPFLRQTIEFAVEPGERIRAFLCLPHGGRREAASPRAFAGPRAAVICFHQHAGNRLLGKSEVVGLAGDPDQAYASELAERGFVTLAADAICFEDRCQDRDAPARAHLRELHHRLIRGQTLLGKILHDVAAAVDLLQTLPAVDPGRIGFIGHSYGGRTALFAPVFDRRIKASVSSCGATPYRHMPGIQVDYVVPGILRHGDLEDVVRLVEPASLLILGGDRDDNWSQDIAEIVTYAQSAFRQGTLESALYPAAHAFTPAMRQHAYRFLAHHLQTNLREAP